MNQNDVTQTLYCAVDGQNIVGTYTTTASTANTLVYQDSGGGSGTLWGYWQNQYYPQIIKESYPVYIQEKAMDKGKQAFELLKALMDKNLVKVDKVKDFIEAMDTILKTL